LAYQRFAQKEQHRLLMTPSYCVCSTAYSNHDILAPSPLAQKMPDFLSEKAAFHRAELSFGI